MNAVSCINTQTDVQPAMLFGE